MGSLDDREVLIVTDPQLDFCPGGALAVPQGDAIVPAVNRLARRFAHVILTQDWHPRGMPRSPAAIPGGSRSKRSRSNTGRRRCGPTIACRARQARHSTPGSIARGSS